MTKLKTPPAPARHLPEVAAKFFRGLADSSRLTILETLRDGPRNVSEVVASTGLSQPNASMHLSCLWRCGLLAREARGRRAYYWIASARVLAVLAAADAALEETAERIAACERYCNEERPTGSIPHARPRTRVPTPGRLRNAAARADGRSEARGDGPRAARR